jgi:hypothetical protein
MKSPAKVGDDAVETGSFEGKAILLILRAPVTACRASDTAGPEPLRDWAPACCMIHAQCQAAHYRWRARLAHFDHCNHGAILGRTGLE